ncbi:flagellar hook-length control protein FliK [Clostridium sp. SM-530-WT-3G]|uniref:flagellar hook-length control protein FliK n=1 Tax=Clostridium sp. SM-530-WT-3G TaxID=2725303 RepID=UPI00145E7E05|nr:flagellar hook-length control protein FliK [Clostridium sp. SM-530-WT-3G]NME82932.1 flagellar hook-length control protein FliK [Clostridium sp. SM-530-WT-3G]
MPGIWNINNGYNINSKKISSKLTFDIGEKFTGRVVSKGEGKDVTIKLSDGWQFIAEVEGNINFEELKLVKFQVDGFENGKLKLKVINQGTKQDSEVDENFKEIIDKEGLSKEDVPILKKMVSYSIPLTRENINKIKGILQFNEKVNFDPDEINKFIEKYTTGKNIDINSAEGKKIQDTLTKFFEQFKNMSEDDIFVFIENNIDFSAENIESFNKLFKGNSSIEKVLMDIQEKLNNIDFDKDIMEAINSKISILDNQESPNINKSSGDTTSQSLASKIYSDNNPMNTKVDVLDLLKTLASNSGDESKSVFGANQNTIIENSNKSLTDRLQDKNFLNDVKSIIGNINTSEEIPKTQASSLIESTNKAKIEALLSRVESREVKLSDDEYKMIKEAVSKYKSESSYEAFPQKTKSMPLNTFNIKNMNTQFSGADKFAGFNINREEAIKENIQEKINNVKDIVKGLLNQTELQDSAVLDKVMSTLKQNMNDFRVFNSISNEYYYLNFGVNTQNTEYPCKLIIKDNRKDGKKIDTTNTKMVVSVKTINLGDIDGYITLRNNKLDVNLKCDWGFSDIINNHKAQLLNGLNSLGMLVNVSVSTKERPVDISSCREFFSEVKISAIDTKV